ncbi:oxidoreductase [Wenzhouxiangella sp. XN24]|uniref:oxidoreductase n=1 Tax=Wenzhouxiangella sp. XN24 TaxID=2713569 RepID=UPI0013EB0515|nr:oxidoreductase [Wenzhouxiangella sp. XN24]NGX15516.1 oxidoreductase [Wenzhouxiangella sp. XN24]
MTSTPVALLAGSTGAVGQRLLARLLARRDGTRIISLGRRAPAPHPWVEHITADLEEFPAVLATRRCSEAFCCLGTTMKRAGSEAAFRAVDLDGVVRFAQAAQAAGAGFFGLVSAAGASPAARNFYLRTKGEAETAIASLDFACIAIMQPGLLRGHREEFRLGERLGQGVAPLLDRLLLGRLARYRSVGIESVAAALDMAARERHPGVRRYGPSDIERLARELQVG